MRGYGQFCPIAKASEVLGERWTTLIIRELGTGSESCNALRRGLPLISPTLLSTRLKTLERAGIVLRREQQNMVSYTLTQAGREIFPIILKLGEWGHRWVRSDMSGRDLDPSLLMWDIHRNLKLDYFSERFGDSRRVLQFEFIDYTTKYHYWWLLVQGADVDVCLKDPGFDINFRMVTEAESLARYWMGDISLAGLLQNGKTRVDGDAGLRRDLGHWLGRNYYAEIRPARLVGNGDER